MSSLMSENPVRIWNISINCFLLCASHIPPKAESSIKCYFLICYSMINPQLTLNMTVTILLSLYLVSVKSFSVKKPNVFPKVKEIEEKRSAVMFPSLSTDVSQTKQQLGSKKLHNYLDRTIWGQAVDKWCQVEGVSGFINKQHHPGVASSENDTWLPRVRLDTFPWQLISQVTTKRLIVSSSECCLLCGWDYKTGLFLSVDSRFGLSLFGGSSELPMWLTSCFWVTFFGRWWGLCTYTWVTYSYRTQ